MLKRLGVALAACFVLATSALAAGTIPFSLSQQLDQLAKPLANCFFYTIQAGTTSTPQNAYQDSALTIPLPNPQRCDAAGRLPQMFLADGSIKVRLTDKNGVTQVVADNVQVIGNSSGGGGGSPVDPTTVFQTGALMPFYGTGVRSGFVRANGRTIGPATSGASERANADCQALFEYLWAADANLVVSTGRGASANADWLANKTIALPDWRGRALAGLDDMGNTAAGRLTSSYFGASAIVLGASGGAESKALVAANLAPHTHNGTTGGMNSNTSHNHAYGPGTLAQASGASAANKWQDGGNNNMSTTSDANIDHSHNFNTDSGVGLSSTPFAVASPMKLATIYLKL